jgi:acetyl-CoA synthetase
MQERIGSRLNPLFKVYQVVAIDALPRTASAKVMRRRLRDDHPDA